MSSPSHSQGDDQNGDGGSVCIKLKVMGQGQDGRVINFRVKMSTQMNKLKMCYSDIIDVPYENLRFLFDGRRINGCDTPGHLGMANNDIIEVYQDQVGGSH